MTTDKARAETILGDIEEALGADRQSDHTMLPGIVKDLREAAAEAAAKLARVEANVARWQHEAEGLREAVRLMHEVLDEVQWSVHTRGIGSTCPVCGGIEDEGHVHDCRLLAALDAAGGA